jgi:hypothetical protein
LDRFAPKKPALNARHIIGLGGTVTFGIVIPYAEEFRRCWRVDGPLAPRPEAERERPEEPLARRTKRTFFVTTLTIAYSRRAISKTF